MPEDMALCDTPAKAAEYWNRHVVQNPSYNPDCECLAVLLLTTRRRVKGHYLVSIGTLDTVLVTPREVFRPAIVLVHNHPSGEPDPSPADMNITRELIRAGRLLRIEVFDHVIIGRPGHCSLKALGLFY